MKDLSLHAGDRIRWTHTDHKRGLLNADQARITAIEAGTPPLSEIDPMTTMPDNGMFEPGAHQRLLRLPEVMRRVGLKRSAIYQRMSEGRFPKSRSLGAKCAVWVESEIDEWIDAIASGE